MLLQKNIDQFIFKREKYGDVIIEKMTDEDNYVDLNVKILNI